MKKKKIYDRLLILNHVEFSDHRLFLFEYFLFYFCCSQHEDPGFFLNVWIRFNMFQHESNQNVNLLKLVNSIKTLRFKEMVSSIKKIRLFWESLK